MLMVNLITWWYTGGWKSFLRGFKSRLRSSLDYFSFSSIIRTLFSPFRQIDAYGSGIQAFFSRLFSRIIGAVIRIFILIFGLIFILFESVIGLIMLVIWPLVPLMPVAGIVLTVMQVHL